MNYRDEILKLYPGSVEMPDASGAPSADYCIVRPATKEDWPENKWVPIGPYVSGDAWKAAYEKNIRSEPPEHGNTPIMVSAAEFREFEISDRERARFGKLDRNQQKVYEEADYMDFAERYADYVCTYEKRWDRANHKSEVATQPPEPGRSWERIIVPDRRDIIGVRTMESGQREFLMHNEALCHPYYIAVEGVLPLSEPASMARFLSVCDGPCGHPYCWSKKPSCLKYTLELPRQVLDDSALEVWSSPHPNAPDAEEMAKELIEWRRFGVLFKFESMMPDK